MFLNKSSFYLLDYESCPLTTDASFTAFSFHSKIIKHATVILHFEAAVSWALWLSTWSGC